MLIAAGTFILIIGVFVGTYWALLVRQENLEQVSVRKRLKGTAQKEVLKAGLVRKEDASKVPMLDKALARAGTPGSPLARLLEESGVNMTPGLFLLASAGLAAGVYVLVQMVAHVAVLALAAGAFASLVPYFYVKYARTARMRKFEELFPEAIDLIARALRAGHAFTTGLKMVAEEMPAPVGTEFRLLHDRQNFGQPLPDALKAFAARIPLIDARFFVTAVLTQRESGGNLSEVLDNLASVIRDRFKVKRQIRVVTAHSRITAFVLVMLPPAMALALYTAGPENFTPLFTDPIGIQMLVGAGILQVAGALIMRKLINFEY